MSHCSHGRYAHNTAFQFRKSMLAWAALIKLKTETIEMYRKNSA